MPELLNTDEAATYLRLSERKLYELVASGAIPCSKVTGRWLFPKAALDRWVASGLPSSLKTLEISSPPIVGGSHDPLLEWALRESGCGLASLPEGSEAGLRRLARREVIAAAIHLHPLTGEHDRANIDAVTEAPGLHDAVLIGFSLREQGLVVAPGNPLGLRDIAQLAHSGLRVARRQDGAGAQLLLLSLLASVGIDPAALNLTRPDCVTGTDIADRIRRGQADCGIATRSVAQAAGMEFVPLIWERFDLVLRQRDYFLPGPSALFGFVRSDRFRQRASDLGGYDLSVCGEIRLVN
ncbi:helix-turn-helix transcriptional regulator [Pseudorhodoplanes sinuspersici]|uniref:DNA-binding protein n=1 Tax=Pseudorhodoplanes sinuspersici TaxID=1235591 RepID=A0A1W6ZM04_9HYPH|nr:helix-turn-helix transcriptional regulator [Pseudorhodoplanes sinuspersici]ARP98150.1 DNA-binding protein [Pseudorhodoplanes sinuspersici]RKE68097.1 excisionase family DNA binding protein [Pseudorhodoplanes sinuspersici]